MAGKKKIVEDKPKADDAVLTFGQKRLEALKAIRDAIREKSGSDSSIGPAKYVPLRRISSGVLALDLAMGGGWPMGRVVLVRGEKSCGKSTCTLLTIADAQKRSYQTNKYIFEEEIEENKVPYRACYVDAEGSFDAIWASELGVDVEQLELVNPGLGEELVDVVQALLSSWAYDIIVVDSLAQISPKAEYEASAFDQQQGAAARLINKMLRKIQTALNLMHRERPDATLPLVFLINQIRQKTGITFGNPNVLPGGKGQEFSSSVTVEFSGNRVTYADGKDKTMPLFTDIDFFIEKNKTSAPKVSGGFSLAIEDIPAEGYKKGEVIEHKFALKMADNLGIIEKITDTEWKVFGETFKRKSDIIDRFVNDENNFLLFKREIVKKRHPKQ